VFDAGVDVLPGSGLGESGDLLLEEQTSLGQENDAVLIVGLLAELAPEGPGTVTGSTGRLLGHDLRAVAAPRGFELLVGELRFPEFSCPSSR
jgi:hypothetical protein